MKKTIFMMGGFALSMVCLTASAQEPTTPTTPATPVTTTTTTATTTTTVWDAKKNPTVDSINAKYKDMMVPARAPMTTEQIFPVLGQYTSTTNTDAANVTITMDPTNKGIVWIEGIPQGKVKAYLRKSPSTYKIPAQKTEDGKEVAEGTLIFDKDANTLNMVIGKPYNVTDPALVFTPASVEEPVVAEVKTKTKGTKTKTKTKAVKAWTYSGTKVEATTVMTTNQ